MKEYIYSDIAAESNLKKLQNKRDIIKDRYRSVEITKMTFYEDRIGNRNYILLESKNIWQMSDDEYVDMRDAIASNLVEIYKDLIKKLKKEDISILVVGLGNPDIIADALGPETIKRIAVTSNICLVRRCESEKNMTAVRVYAISTGVFGNSGIETLDIITGISEKILPDIVLVVDSLAAKSCKRMGAAVQISDAGIAPGSGIGNRQREISRMTLGIPVVSIGVPTVVNSATMIAEALAELPREIISDQTIDLLNIGKGFFVTPKEIDVMIKSSALLLSDAINKACTFSCHKSEY